MKTPEQKAVEQYFSKTPRQYGNGGCGCMGPQNIRNFNKTEEPYNLELEDISKRSQFILYVHKTFEKSLAQAKEMVDNKKVGLENPYTCKRYKEELDNIGIKTIIIKKATGLEPECPCRMDNIEEVDGNYYRIVTKETVRELNDMIATTHTTYEAILLGSVGGPYQNTDWHKI